MFISSYTAISTYATGGEMGGGAGWGCGHPKCEKLRTGEGIHLHNLFLFF